MIALIDYGAGNLASVRKALRACGAEVVEPAGPADLDRASAIVLPGVGHFAATATLAGGLAGSHPTAPGRRRVAVSASASACSGSSRAATKRRRSPASDGCPAGFRGCPTARRTGAG